jgi:hypothetical protein
VLKLKITQDNACQLVRVGRSRGCIENEALISVKNQGDRFATGNGGERVALDKNSVLVSVTMLQLKYFIEVARGNHHGVGFTAQ